MIALIAFPAWRLSRPMLRTWRHDKAMAQTSEYAESQDYRNLVLSLQRASQLAPNDVDTWKMIADYLSDLNLHDSVVARENVLKFTPQSLAPRIALAPEAIRFGEVATAKTALDVSNPKAVTDSNFHQVSATLALILGDTEALLEHLEILISLEPNNSEARFNLAAVQILQGDPAKRSQAIASLEKLLSDPQVRVRAALELLKDSTRQLDNAHAQEVAKAIVSKLGTHALDTTRIEFSRLLAVRQSAAANSPGDVTLVARWTGEIRRKSEALRWIDSLPPEIQQVRSVREITAELTLGLDLRIGPTRWSAPGCSVPLTMAWLYSLSPPVSKVCSGRSNPRSKHGSMRSRFRKKRTQQLCAH
ncbi:MAG: hypothetical protein J6386_07235 [Candidatus Synoicihabitans palmerolidicus]|nr:hypothetical protein [Candidatus Synoicihabitans palmerolidicus]